MFQKRYKLPRDVAGSFKEDKERREKRGGGAERSSFSGIRTGDLHPLLGRMRREIAGRIQEENRSGSRKMKKEIDKEREEEGRVE